MTPSVLGQVSLGYQLLWNQLRQLGGVQLFIGADSAARVDAAHLLRTLDEAWSAQAPVLLLCAQSPRLLADLLDHAQPGSPWLEVPSAQLKDAGMVQRVQQAHQRGLRLVWRGEPGTRPPAALASCFVHTMVSLSAEEALSSLRLSLRKHHGADAARANSPVQAGQIYEAVASRALIEHCLDEQGAWGVAGWPMEEVLHGYRHQRIQPGHRAVVDLLESIDRDDSADHIEQALSEEPLLAYRFARYLNSAGLGLSKEVQSVRHGLMVLGLTRVRAWLLEQLPNATSDLNLQPVRTALVLRARLMAHLLDAGDSDELRREVFWCGLLSQMDLLLGESLHSALGRLALPERITAAVLNHAGPYMPFLEVASALESPRTHVTRALCETHQMDLESVNRALLATLSHARLRPAKGRLLV
jgi:c-di-GMP phosphodiesterase